MSYSSIFRSLLASIVFSMLGACAVSDHKNISEMEPDSIRAKLDELIKKYDIENTPGLALSVVHDGKVVYLGGVGLANLEHNIPVTQTTVFDIASVSKQFTAMAIAMLIDQGKLGLNDDIRQYLPELPDYGERIEIRHLLYHTSGLRDWLDLMMLAGWRVDDVFTIEQIRNMILRQEQLNFRPGSEQRYSNTGYFLLSEIISQVTGAPFGKWMADNVFTPLDMKHTHIHDDPHRLVPNRAYSYYFDGENGYKVMNHGAATLGSSGVFTTAEDLAKWMQNFQTVKLGNPAIMEMMNNSGALDNGEPVGYGFGNGIYETEQGLKTIAHGGLWPMFNSALYRYPQYHLAFGVMANSDQANIWEISNKIAEMYVLPRPSEETGKSAEEKENLPLTQDQIERIPGEYWREETSHIATVKIEEGTLRFMRSEHDGSPLGRVEKNKFRMLGVNDDVVLNFDLQNGRIDMVEKGESFSYFQVKDPDYSASGLKRFEGEFYSKELLTQYSMRVISGKLVARHVKHGNIACNKNLDVDVFKCEAGYFWIVRFARDEKGAISGFYLDQQWGNKKLWFDKVDI